MLKRMAVRGPLLSCGVLLSTLGLALLLGPGCDRWSKLAGVAATLPDLRELLEEELWEEGAQPEDRFSAAGRDQVRRELGGFGRPELRARLFHPSATGASFKEISQEQARPEGGLEYDLKLQVDGEEEELEFVALVTLHVVFSQDAQGKWLIERLAPQRVDTTVANTSLIYKWYYAMLLLNVLLLLSRFRLIFKEINVPAELAERYALVAGKVGILPNVIMVFFMVVGWLAYFFPEVYVSHFGFYWLFVVICGTMSMSLVTDNIAHHDGELFGARFLNWALAAIPVVIFFAFPAKFTPEQSSVLDIRFNHPALVSARVDAPLLDQPHQVAPVAAPLRAGSRLDYLDTIEGQDGRYFKVIGPGSTIGYLRLEQGNLLMETRHFQLESEFTTELTRLLATPPPEEGPADVLAQIGASYAEQARQRARQASLQDHLEALALYHQALRFAPGQEPIQLARAFSTLEVIRAMQRDQVNNPFGMLHSSAVSYNKTRSLACQLIQLLKRHVRQPDLQAERSALITAAHLLAGDADEERVAQLGTGVAGAPYHSLYARLLVAERPQPALELIEELLRQDPTHSLLVAERATLLLRAGQAEAARAAFERALALAPGNTRAMAGLAATHAAAGRPADASQWLHKAWERDANYASELRLCTLLREHGFQARVAVWSLLGLFLFFLFVPVLHRTGIGAYLRMFLHAGLLTVICGWVWYLIVDGTAGGALELTQTFLRAYFLGG